MDPSQGGQSRNEKDKDKEINVGELITLSLHNEGLKEVIEKIVNKLRVQQKIEDRIEKKILQMEKTIALTSFEVSRIQEQRARKEKEVEKRFQERKQAQKQLERSMEEKYIETKSLIKSINLESLRQDVCQLIQANKGQFQKQVESLNSHMQSAQAQLLSTISSTISENSSKLSQTTNALSNKLQNQIAALVQSKDKVQAQIEKQQLQISNFRRDTENQRNKIENSMSCLKDDILASVPKLLSSMLRNQTEEQNEKLKRSIEEQELVRTKQQKYFLDKIHSIEEKESKLEQLVKQFQIQMHIMANNILNQASNPLPADRRGSKASRVSTAYSKKMTYDVMIEKILLLEQQLSGANKLTQNLKDKIHQVEAQLQSNPLLSDFSSNVYIKQLLEDMIQKNLRTIENRLVSKLDSDRYERDLKTLRQRIDMMSLDIIDKCEKGEIKKAFQFLQQKLKDVITLVGTKQHHERDPFIDKQIVKCLSCDKEVDKSRSMVRTPTTQYRVWKKILNKENDTERVNQLGLSSNSLRKLIRTARHTDRTKN